MIPSALAVSIVRPDIDIAVHYSILPAAYTTSFNAIQVLVHAVDTAVATPVRRSAARRWAEVSRRPAR